MPNSNSPTVSQYLTEQPNSAYDVRSYSWDGLSRPNIDDYTAPWIKQASQTPHKYAFGSKRKDYNAQIAYAQNQLQAALKKYEADLKYWQEQDERNYTSPSSQSARYEDAGYNMGYLYGNVDSGNSAVGYEGTEGSIDVKNGTQEKSALDAVTEIVGVVTSLVSSGVSLAQLPAKINQMASSSKLTDATREWAEFLRSHDSEGNESSMANSIAFVTEQVTMTMNQNLANKYHWDGQVQQTFSQYCARIYEQQSKGDSYQEALKFVEGLDAPDWLKGTLIGIITLTDLSAGWSGKFGKKR